MLQVALPLPLPPMSYLPPLGQEGEEALGRRVAVPFRGEVQVGVVVGALSPSLFLWTLARLLQIGRAHV